MPCPRSGPLEDRENGSHVQLRCVNFFFILAVNVQVKIAKPPDVDGLSKKKSNNAELTEELEGLAAESIAELK